MTTPRLVTPTPCGRCRGTGSVPTGVTYQGVPGRCRACAGSGEAEGDSATLKAARDAARQLRQAAENRRAMAEGRRRQVRTWLAAQPRGAEMAKALLRLRTFEPQRVGRAEESILAGHPGVGEALLAYNQIFVDQGLPRT